MDDALEQLRTQVRANRDLPPPAMCMAIRKAAGVSRKTIAGVVGVSEMAIAYWETGKRRPRDHHRAKYLAALQALQEA